MAARARQIIDLAAGECTVTVVADDVTGAVTSAIARTGPRGLHAEASDGVHTWQVDVPANSASFAIVVPAGFDFRSAQLTTYHRFPA